MMATKRLIAALVIGAFALCAMPGPLAFAQSTGSPALKAITSDAGSVRVVIKPKSVAAGSPWEFEVTMDTHTKPLTEDLTKISVLFDDSQARYAAIAWQGDVPGSHHRKGVLRFPAPAKSTGTFRIQIDGLGGPGNRVFQWKAN